MTEIIDRAQKRAKRFEPANRIHSDRRPLEDPSVYEPTTQAEGIEISDIRASFGRDFPE